MNSAQSRAPHPNGLRWSDRRGLTLVEVMVAVGLFTILAGSVISAALYARKAAEVSLYESTAMAVCTGYMEQLKSMPYADLRNSITTGVVNAELDQGVPDPLNLNQWNTRKILIDDNNYRGTRKFAEMRFYVQIVDRQPTSSRDLMMINIVAAWPDPVTGVINRYVAARSARSN